MTATSEAVAESIRRAEQGLPCQNDADIIEHYAALGIAATPRVDVFTYRIWQAKGRQVRKGEHGCKITTWRQSTKTDPETGEKIAGRAPVEGLDPAAAAVDCPENLPGLHDPKRKL